MKRSFDNKKDDSGNKGNKEVMRLKGENNRNLDKNRQLTENIKQLEKIIEMRQKDKRLDEKRHLAENKKTLVEKRQLTEKVKELENIIKETEKQKQIHEKERHPALLKRKIAENQHLEEFEKTLVEKRQLAEKVKELEGIIQRTKRNTRRSWVTTWECPICFESKTSSTRLFSTPCGHVFCQTCINNLADPNGECPICHNAFLRSQLFPVYF